MHLKIDEPTPAHVITVKTVQLLIGAFGGGLDLTVREHICTRALVVALAVRQSSVGTHNHGSWKQHKLQAKYFQALGLGKESVANFVKIVEVNFMEYKAFI